MLYFWPNGVPCNWQWSIGSKQPTTVRNGQQCTLELEHNTRKPVAKQTTFFLFSQISILFPRYFNEQKIEFLIKNELRLLECVKSTVGTIPVRIDFSSTSASSSLRSFVPDVCWNWHREFTTKEYSAKGWSTTISTLRLGSRFESGMEKNKRSHRASELVCELSINLS